MVRVRVSVRVRVRVRLAPRVRVRLAPVLDHVARLPLGGLLRLGPREGPRVRVPRVRALDAAPRRVRLDVQRVQGHLGDTGRYRGDIGEM